MAEALAVNGAAKVFLLGRRSEVIKEAAAKYPEIMVPVQCDVSSKESLQSAVNEVSKTSKHINLLVANSGIGGQGIGFKPTLSLSDLREHLMSASMEKFTETLHVNTTGAWFTMVAFLELLDAGNKHAVSGGGKAFGAPSNSSNQKPSIQSQVIFTTSLASVSRGYWTKPDYGSSKAALSFLMKQASTNLARYGIRANALAPGRTSIPYPPPPPLFSAAGPSFFSPLPLITLLLVSSISFIVPCPEFCSFACTAWPMFQRVKSLGQACCLSPISDKKYKPSWLTNVVRLGCGCLVFPSDLTVGMLANRNPEDEGPDDERFIPSQKFGGPEEMAGSLLYLASRAGSFTNGNVILFDGGRAAVIPASY